MVKERAYFRPRRRLSGRALRNVCPFLWPVHISGGGECCNTKLRRWGVGAITHPSKGTGWHHHRVHFRKHPAPTIEQGRHNLKSISIITLKIKDKLITKDLLKVHYTNTVEVQTAKSTTTSGNFKINSVEHTRIFYFTTHFLWINIEMNFESATYR